MDEIVTQLGLILSQLRVTRRAVEDIERSTARYGGFGFASALAAGPKLGEPPMFAGALKVYVVNINDLAPGGGFGSFLEGLLGGAGRAVGGFFSGLFGGTISSLALPFMIGKLERLAGHVERILDKLGMGKAGADKKDESGKPAAAMDLTSTLQQLNVTLEMLTGLFTAAGKGPDEASKGSKIVESDTGARWLAMLTVADRLLANIKHVVDGLIMLVPILVGALAQVIVRLGDIKQVFLGLLQFVLRNVLLVRGIALTTIYDTVGAAAGLMVKVLGILQVAVDKLLTSVFAITGALIGLALGAIEKLGAGLKLVVDSVVKWVEGPVLSLLAAIADSLLFRFLMHIVRVLPAILPPIYEIATKNKLTDLTALNEAKTFVVTPPATPGTGAKSKDGFPDFGALLKKDPKTDIFLLKKMHDDTTETLRKEGMNLLNTTTGAIADVEKALKKAATNGELLFDKKLQKDIGKLRDHAQTMADALKPAVDAAERRPETGLETIARAYEEWVKTDGLKQVLGQITEHFKSPEGKPVLETTVKGGTPTPAGPVPVTVEIKNIVIELEPGTAGLPTHEKLSLAPLTPENMLAHMHELAHELRERGADDAVSSGALYGQLGTGA